jgi:hypothetical protein
MVEYVVFSCEQNGLAYYGAKLANAVGSFMTSVFCADICQVLLDLIHLCLLNKVSV